jgi:hypothetical protein
LLDYYINFNISFGLQATFIGGFLYTGVTQMNIQNPADWSDETTTILRSIFWILSGISLACVIHVILTTTLLQVMSRGLALSGPTGSVTKAGQGI